jgi:hypothetical protein
MVNRRRAGHVKDLGWRVPKATRRRASTRTTYEGRNSIGGWYGVLVTTRIRFRAPQVPLSGSDVNDG